MTAPITDPAKSGFFLCRQWCNLHDCHFDDPEHDYQYPDCESGVTRESTPEEDAAVIAKWATQPDCPACLGTGDKNRREVVPLEHQFLCSLCGGTGKRRKQNTP